MGAAAGGKPQALRPQKTAGPPGTSRRPCFSIPEAGSADGPPGLGCPAAWHSHRENRQILSEKPIHVLPT